MGGFRPKTFGITIIAIVSVIAILLFTTNSDGGVGADIPIPTLDIQTLGDGTRVVVEEEVGGGIFIIIEEPPVTNIACWVAQTAVLRNEAGGFIGNVKSDFLRSSPLIATPVASVIDIETDMVLDLGTITTTPQIKCSTGKIIISPTGAITSGQVIDPETAFEQTFPSFELPLTVEKSFFTIRIYASQPNNTWIEVYNQPYIVEKFDINSPSHINLPPAIIQQAWIQNGLPDGRYDTTYKIVYDGAFLIHWKEQGVCGTNCASIDFVIPVVTDRTFTGGVLTNVSNEFEVNRDISVGVVGNDGGGIECDGITESVDADTGTCKPIPPSDQPCPQGQVKSGTVCITIGNGTVDGVSGGIDVKVQELIGKLQTCIESGNATCLASSDFLPFWIFAVGLVVVLGAVAQRRQPDIYGVPSGF